jgi:hypothetical protein
MKKIILAIVVILICSTTFADIETSHDKFRGTDTICSEVLFYKSQRYADLGGFLVISLCYITKGGKPIDNSYYLLLGRAKEEIRLATVAEFKIDNNDISPMERIKAISHNGMFSLPMILVRQIREAKTLAIRVHYYEKSSITWEVPERILKEWQDLINNSPLK